jgi:hypothetical protein
MPKIDKLILAAASGRKKKDEDDKVGSGKLSTEETIRARKAYSEARSRGEHDDKTFEQYVEEVWKKGGG